MHAMNLDRRAPAAGPPFRLILPFQHVLDHPGREAAQGRPFAAAQALDLLGDVCDIGFVESPFAEKLRLPEGPRIRVSLIRGAGLRLRRCATGQGAAHGLSLQDDGFRIPETRRTMNPLRRLSRSEDGGQSPPSIAWKLSVFRWHP